MSNLDDDELRRQLGNPLAPPPRGAGLSQAAAAPALYTPDTGGYFGWRYRHLPDEQFVRRFTHVLDACFGHPQPVQLLLSEANLRDTTLLFLANLIAYADVVPLTEVPTSHLNDGAGEWRGSRLHRLCKDELYQGTENERRRGIERADLVIWSPLHRTAGLLAEFKMLKSPGCFDTEKMSNVFKECIFQCAFYVGAFYQQCGTRLGIAVVNSRFTRLVLTRKGALAIEVHDDLMDQGTHVGTIDRLAGWEEFWERGPRHNILDGSEQLELYWECFAQGCRQTAALIDGKLPRNVGDEDTALESDTDSPGQSQRSQTAPPRQGKRRRSGSSGGGPSKRAAPEGESPLVDLVDTDSDDTEFEDDDDDEWFSSDEDDMNPAELVPHLQQVLQGMMRVSIVDSQRMSEIISQLVPT